MEKNVQFNISRFWLVTAPISPFVIVMVPLNGNDFNVWYNLFLGFQWQKNNQYTKISQFI